MPGTIPAVGSFGQSILDRIAHSPVNLVVANLNSLAVGFATILLSASILVAANYFAGTLVGDTLGSRSTLGDYRSIPVVYPSSPVGLTCYSRAVGFAGTVVVAVLVVLRSLHALALSMVVGEPDPGNYYGATVFLAELHCPWVKTPNYVCFSRTLLDCRVIRYEY